MLWPTRKGRSFPGRAARKACSASRCSGRVAGTGPGERPWPGRSTARTWARGARAWRTRSHRRELLPAPWTRTTGGPFFGSPASRWWRRSEDDTGVPDEVLLAILGADVGARGVAEELSAGSAEGACGGDGGGDGAG